VDILKMGWAILALLFGATFSAQADSPSDYAFVFLNSDQDQQEECVLREKGWRVINNPITISGKRINESECLVALDKKLFSRTFQMCSLVGSNSANTSGSSCDFSTAIHGEIVEFSSGSGIFKIDRRMPASASCMWACKLQPGKK